MDIYTVNKSVVLSLQYDIDLLNLQSAYDYEYIQSPTFSKFDYKALNTVTDMVSESYQLNKFNRIVYIGQFPNFDNCKIFLCISSDNIISSEHDVLYVYIVDNFYEYIHVKVDYDSDKFVEFNVKRHDKPKTLLGFFFLGELFIKEFLAYNKSNNLYEFMNLPKNVVHQVVGETENAVEKLTRTNNEDIVIKMDNKVDNKECNWTELCTYQDIDGNEYKEYVILYRGDHMKTELDIDSVECNCLDFFYRADEEEKCKHIENFLYLHDDIPEGYLVDENTAITSEGKEFLVRFRIDNGFDVFKV